MVDAIRSAYSCQARFYKDDPTKLTTIKWYFTPILTPAVPYAHPFGQRVWDEREGEPQPQLGEVYGTRSYYNGKPLNYFTDYGLCGRQEQWEQGCLTTDTIPPKYHGTDVPTCCGVPWDLDPFAVAYCCDCCDCNCCGDPFDVTRSRLTDDNI